ncbi:hypothetical protein RUM43_000293 [Polyplax serrata]|uniref:RING-type domain-containing protein n=1 Tax=Polyplax serrata TaxID=468196 RepID=A0AAN8SCA5_POLSC
MADYDFLSVDLSISASKQFRLNWSEAKNCPSTNFHEVKPHRSGTGSTEYPKIQKDILRASHRAPIDVADKGCLSGPRKFLQTKSGGRRRKTRDERERCPALSMETFVRVEDLLPTKQWKSVCNLYRIIDICIAIEKWERPTVFPNLMVNIVASNCKKEIIQLVDGYALKSVGHTYGYANRTHSPSVGNVDGCKIKALRAKTNTYIKTPVRGEEPVFVVTGRKEDVAKAKREILSAAEHFSQIRASRKTNLGGLLGGLSPPGPPANIPGQVTIQVRVPYRVVGLVVGPKGATIKRIQQQTHTYIVTPSRDKEPVFEVSGLPENVQAAKREIEAHIAMRTGAGTLNGANMADLLGAPLIEDNTELLASLYKTGLGSLFSCLDAAEPTSALTSDTLSMFPPTSLTSSTSSGAFSSSGSLSSTSSSSSNGRLGDLVSIWNSSLERDEGIGESPGFETTTASSNIWSFPSSASTTGITTRPSPTASASPTGSLPSITSINLNTKRDCVVCGEKEINAALVPCGHNLFCLDCASRLCDGTEPSCPICSRTEFDLVDWFWHGISAGGAVALELLLPLPPPPPPWCTMKCRKVRVLGESEWFAVAAGSAHDKCDK